jgi:hypothetical protein
MHIKISKKKNKGRSLEHPCQKEPCRKPVLINRAVAPMPSTSLALGRKVIEYVGGDCDGRIAVMALTVEKVEIVVLQVHQQVTSRVLFSALCFAPINRNDRSAF